jgi:hypothetical protein
MSPAPQAILDLAERFHHNRDHYRRADYGETQARREFIDPFFTALGWDVDNTAGNAPRFRDVTHEASVVVRGAARAPDYCFQQGRTRLFFVEAKKPSVNIAAATDPAYQLRSYGWSGKLKLSILTDFEEFAVYDCAVRPAANDAPGTARIMLVNYREYGDRWDEIAAVFAKQAVLKGDLDRYIASNTAKRGTQDVDDAFLAEMEQWREQLARNVALRNPRLGSSRDLTYAVQMIVDRLVFLRICEDRGIEPFGQLRDAAAGANVYAALQERFQRADARYNSGLFHFSAERGREAPDDLTPGLTVDDAVLKKIIASLYYPSPYQFREMGADILGSVYERFLGSVIRLTPAHQARVEQKPEVRKAGGVYYTPRYIVDYIVAHTVGALCRGNTPAHIAGLRFLDPACGSGSFLLGAYQWLLDYHLQWYGEHPAERQSRDRTYRRPDGELALTREEKARLLTANLYGVDIDAQAVEVTRLSLCLKLLEGETEGTLSGQMALLAERALPDLAANIKCGNSLIGPDFYDGQLTLLDEEEQYRINVFDWRAEFRAIMAAGGFDAVIGNPPYVRPHNIEKADKEYFWRRYRTFVAKSDLYNCFLEQSVLLLRQRGLLGMIVSDGWLRLDSFQALREMLLRKTSILTLIDFAGDVFEQANVKTAVIVLNNDVLLDHFVQVATTPVVDDLEYVRLKPVRQTLFQQTYKSILDLSLDETQSGIKDRMRMTGSELGSQFELSFGLKTGDDKMFLVSECRGVEYKPILRGADIHRYSTSFRGEWVRYVPQEMVAHRRTARPGVSARFEQPKVLVRDTGAGLQCTLDDDSYYAKDVLIVSDKARNRDRLLFLTGVLNAKLLRFYYETSFPTLHVQRDELAAIPIRTIDFDSPADVARHDQMVALVERMLALHKDLAAAATPVARNLLQRQIDATDRQIDRLVYALYDLTPEEIAIVEGA